ncbi:MAG TPA: GTPase ObgE [Candidatus Saccharibacteria bacterium]|nr:GTPase ObgE [Candidatus Saccharibacteria bacterium]HRK94534.1 GTPase ObgE [Candidatus Saccharibacteria bacterium]
MFVDTAKVFIQAGKGGDGAVSFRHEIYVDKGGPDGGDGGRGGDVIFHATKNLNTLLDFRYKPELKAAPGKNGAKQNKRGRSGEPLIVKVPMGTVVKRGNDIIADLVGDDEEVVIAHGGDGGFGNAHFKSSTRQAPKIAELGEPGETFEAELELKLLADVGLVGFPNAGKSTFLSVVSNARPEIADYAFTTLSPNLGVATIDKFNLLIADIPGLIEGASEGKGLGDAFLRHVERTSVLLHLVDAYSNDIAADYKTIRDELAAYSNELTGRPEVVALTKTEGLDDEMIGMQVDEIKKVAGHERIFAISSTAHKGLNEVLRELKMQVETARAKATEETDSEDDGIHRITLSDDQKAQAWTVKRVEEENRPVFVVRGHKIEKFARRTNFEGYENINRLRDIMKKMGITHELKRAGAEGDSIIRIGRAEFTLVEQ